MQLSKVRELYGSVKKVHGPYTRKDDRQHVVLAFEDLSTKTVSYPKLLVELKSGFRLRKGKTVHHKDGDFTNNDPDNLEVLDSAEHAYKDARKCIYKTATCVWCGKEFELSKEQMATRNRGRAGPFCSRSCSGKYATSVQHNKITPFKRKGVELFYESNGTITKRIV